ncbi:AraC family transcriptional regulator [Thalassospira sp. HF15]|uniref:AraC family transcriptional regulator n=1 Tax=Thalassospira sp. HF15 TaxID=2722755 RepID=UPI00142F428D|nr:helix-turn-helix transcriptional regulator [Thalassospira sp. HF15]NIY76850.1 AraC family transcriptional regulator [Thalassospira sp. HF15]
MSYLQNHTILSSGDLDEVRESIMNLASRHDFDIKGPNAELNVRVAAVESGDLGLMHVSLDVPRLSVTSSEQDPDGLLLYMVTSGSGIAQHCGEEFTFSSGQGFMRDLAEPISAQEDNFGAFVLRLSKEKLKNYARSVVGEDIELPGLEFDPVMVSTTPGWNIFRSTVHYVAETLDGPLHEMQNPIVTTQMNDILTAQCLSLLPNSYQDIINGRSIAAVVPYYVKRARDYIHAHADKKLGLADISAAAGCGYRGLQKGFMDAFGTTPMAYLRTVRLKRVRAILKSEPYGKTVSEIAQKWGFTHMGRFAQDYYREFGELPSETIRKHT